MTSAVQIRRDTAAVIATVTPIEGELAYATDTKRLSIGDGVTLGGTPLAKTTEASPVETQVHAATGKTTPVDADEIGIVDSAASNVLKKLTWANLKATLWTALGALISGGTGKTTPVDADTFALSDSAASSATKKLTWANVKATLNTYFSGLGSLSIVAGDLLYGASAGVLARLAKGSDGQFLSLVSGIPAWATVAAGGATARNRIVNPSMQISSINGNVSGTTAGYSPADNWGTFRVTSAGTITTQRVQSATAAGSKDRARITITAADASLAAGEYLTFTQSLVGQEVADLLYGAAGAKNTVLRFGFKGPAGTYAVSLNNAAVNRSYVALFTISAPNANVDTVQTLSIVGDTTGTWLTDTGVGLTLNITLACGSTFQGVAGWQAGQMFGTSGVSNGMGTISAVFEIFDVGLYLDAAATGVAPTFETPSLADVYSQVAYTPWVKYTASFTGLGTVSPQDVWSRRRGDSLQLKATFTLGTTTAVEGQMTLGFNGINANVTSDATKVASLQICGVFGLSVALAASGYALIESGVGYITFGFQTSGRAAIAKLIGTNVGASTNIVSLTAEIPISGW